MLKLVVAMLTLLATAYSAELPSKKYINLAAIKTMVSAAEAEAKKLNVDVTICIVDESGNLLFLQKGDTAPLNTIDFARRCDFKVTIHEIERVTSLLSSKNTQNIVIITKIIFILDHNNLFLFDFEFPFFCLLIGFQERFDHL